jgi:hypothetical protein
VEVTADEVGGTVVVMDGAYGARSTAGRASIALVLAVLTAALAVGCDESVDDAAEPPGAAAYAMVIARFLPPAIDPDERPVAYVVPVNGEALALDVQVAVIDALSEVGDVRFVDDVGAAVDEESSDLPPRDEGTLVGLGRFSADAPYTVRVELYRGRDRVDGRLLTVRSEDGNWVVIDSETVAPEVLVADE